MRQLPHMNELAEKPGVHVVGLYAQVQPLADIEHILTKMNVKYPLAMDSFWDAGYEAPSLPKVWVIGVDGKIAFIGGSGYDEIIDKELAKAKYPGLGRADIHKDVEPAAKAFAAGNFAEAYKLAEAVYDNTEDDKAEADAEYVMERIDDRIGTLSVRAETAEVMKDYQLAINCWTEMLKYKGMDDAEEAPERLKKLTDSETIKKEIAARHALLTVMMDLDVIYQDVDDTDAAKVAEFRKKCREAYQAFAKENAGTGAGERAADLVKTFTDLIPKEEKPAEEPKEAPKDK